MEDDMAITVMTVLGPVPADQLGVTLMHEHLLIDLCRVTRHHDGVLNEIPLAIHEIEFFKAAGGSTVVDVTNRILGQNPCGLVTIAKQTGLNVVMGCGWYREPFYDQSVYLRTTNQIAEEMVRDIEEGVDGTGIRAGIIGEIGADLYHISPAEERVFRAAARAHKRTGLTVTTHAVRSPVGLDQLDLLEEEGMDLRRVVIGHCDFYPHMDYHEAVARRGAYVEFDSIGRGFVEWDIQRRLEWLKNLIDKGYLRQILLSHDVCFKSHLRAFGGQGYDYVVNGFVPRMMEAGISKEQIEIMMVANPRAALTGVVD
jgi:predicted metal-dependent phosphotriesterase family hydrolase